MSPITRQEWPVEAGHSFSLFIGQQMLDRRYEAFELRFLSFPVHARMVGS